MAETRAPGLRVQIVVALAGLMALAFVPLFFAVVSLARATLQGGREQTARAIGRAVAAHVGDARRMGDLNAMHAAVDSHVGRDGIDGVCVYGPTAEAELCAGDLASLALRPHAPPPYQDGVRVTHGSGGRAADVTIAVGNAAILTRVSTEHDAARAAPLVGLVAIYMTTFALALLTFAYFALTRLIVRPIDALAQATDRVANGSRTLHVPRAGAREIAELGASVQQMTTSLMAEELALRNKIEELTLTTRRLTEAREQLVRSERMASVGRLAAGIAHEIGNPIAALMGMEDLMLDDDLPLETQRDFLQRMKRETERIHTVVHDLLDFARPEATLVLGETAALAPPPAVVRDVLDDVSALLRPQKGWKGIALETDVEADDLRVKMAADKLTQIVLNLAMNAGDALAAGSLGEASVPQGRVSLRARADGARVIVEVEDTGPGVAKSLGERAFEPFVTTKEVGKGTGLGLAVCRGLVESAGGEILIDATYTDGARFIVRLPRAR